MVPGQIFLGSPYSTTELVLGSSQKKFRTNIPNEQLLKTADPVFKSSIKGVYSGTHI